jgi:hypothetical protein
MQQPDLFGYEPPPVPASALTPEEKEGLAEAAPLIREHLWLGNSPPPPPHPKDSAWSMGRCLSVWIALLRTGREPEEINGAIRHVRDIMTDYTGQPLTMRVLYFKDATPIFEQARARWINAQSSPERGAKLPPSVAKILQGMIG